MDKERRFDLNDLITEEDIQNVRKAARECKEWREEVEWRRKHDPNFEKWYAEECRKINEEWNSHITTISDEEMKKKMWRDMGWELKK